ncbi:MAG: WYL domain-containing transcriptional regulator [Calditrichaeota bacterium]|jgi:predicted DNA-binding transcriptional regulator YafY|nr:WYL domain-containing transcriptional regulator [Calditrichota bacterium]MBT7788622.1 WYL domain-containing transcriptional regulator [Calditrichota bacterium]
MPNQTQIERILRIIQILSAGTKLTTGALLSRFDNDVSLRTLQRDFQRIQAAGIPLRSRKSKANENEWYLDSASRSFLPRTLGLNEYLASYILRENLKVFRNTSFANEIDSLVDKIEQIVPDDVFMRTEEIDPSQLYENYSAGIYDYSGSDELIANLMKAILERRNCFVRYYNANEEKNKGFYIEPRRLVYYSGSLYVVGYIRHFDNFVLLAVQRIHKLKIQDSVFPDEPEFDAQSFWAGKFGLFAAESTLVRLKFNKGIRHHIEGRTWHPSQSFDSDSDGNLFLEMCVGLTPELISWILGWSDYVKVQEPPELIEMVKERIKAMADIYKGGKSK